MSDDPVKRAAEQADAWADHLSDQGFTGSARMMGQVLGRRVNEVTPVFERKIGDAPSVEKRHLLPSFFSGDGPFTQWDLHEAAQAWREAKRRFEEAERNLVNVASKMRD